MTTATSRRGVPRLPLPEARTRARNAAARQAAARSTLERVDRVLARRDEHLDPWSLRMSCAAADLGHVLVVLNAAGPDQLRACVIELLISDPVTKSVDAVLDAAARPIVAATATAASSRSEQTCHAVTFDQPNSRT